MEIHNQIAHHPAINPDTSIYKEKPEDVLSAELAKEMTKRTSRLEDSTIDLALRVKQAREFMDWSTHHVKSAWLDWMEQANVAAKDMTQTRMAIERESKIVVANAKDVREFFNSEEYQKAHLRMAEMVTILDRFSQLKANGTLDAFADFILKVKCD